MKRYLFAALLAFTGFTVAPSLTGTAIAKKSKHVDPDKAVDPRKYDPDCIHTCHDKQKDCMLECAKSTDDAENQSCNDECVGKYITCGRACPARKY